MSSLIKDERTGIVYRKWLAASPKAVLLLIHGICAHSGRWQFLAEHFLKHGISSYAIELKDFNQAEGSKDRIESLDIYYSDIASLRGMIAGDCPGKNIYIVGESAGGIIAFMAAALKPGLFEGLVCISPAFASKLNLPIADYIKIFLSALYDPGRQFIMPITPSMCTRDSDYQKTMDSERKDHQRTTSRVLVDIALAQVRSRLLRDKIKLPVLFLIAGDDSIVDPKASVGVFRSLKTHDKEMFQYAGMRHSLSIELGRETVFQDMRKWLQKRI